MCVNEKTREGPRWLTEMGKSIGKKLRNKDFPIYFKRLLFV